MDDDHRIGRGRGTCMCSGCGSPILDQFILRVAPDLEWHASCLKCADCGLMLEEMRTCFVRDGKTYCKMDYLRLFGAKCTSCKLGFGVSDLVMRARSHVYHVDCFRCVACGRQLVPGDEFALGDDGLLCRVDHDLALDQQLQCPGAIGGAGGSGLKSLALSPSDSVNNDDFTSACTANINNNNNNETITNNVSGGEKNTRTGGGHSSRSGSRSHKSSDQKTTRIRTVLNEKQLHTLRTCYGANPRPDALMKEQLVEMTGLSPRVIRVWFQNKRCKDKKRSILMKQLQLQQQQQHQHQDKVKLDIGPKVCFLDVVITTRRCRNEACAGDEMWLYHKGAAMMAGSPGHEVQFQQQLQQHVLPGDLHHQYQTGLPQPPPSTSSSSPWQTLSELAELQADDMDDGGSLPLQVPPLAAPTHAGLMATPFQQLVGSFGPAAGETDDDTVVSLDEPLHHGGSNAAGRDAMDLHKAVRSAHVLFAAQRLNASA